jgi:V8-like Glu-specific endopeptidase
LDELAVLPDVPASAEIPPEIAEEFARQRLYLSGVEDEPTGDGRLRRIEDGAGAWELRLPPGADIGRPGQDTTVYEASREDLERAHTDAFRPDWIPLSYLPRLADEFTWRPPLLDVDGTPVQPLFVFPPDDRKVYMPNMYPWHCTGRLFIWDNFTPNSGPDSWGSAVLVGPRHVLTAKHVCPASALSPPPPPATPRWKMLFIPAYENGSSVYGPGVRSFVSNIAFLSGATAAHDVAVLRLSDAALGTQLGWLDIFDYFSLPAALGPSDGPFFKTGYPAGVASALRPSFEENIRLLSAVPDGSSLELRHKADVEGGTSGAPLWGFIENPPGVRTPKVFGVTSGAHENTQTGERYNVDAGGWPIQSIVAFARSFWP